MLDLAAEANRPIRVLIVDDHAMFAESIARLFERESDIVVVGLAATSADAITAAAATLPDVAVVDYGLPDADGARTAAGIRAVSPTTTVVVLTGLPDAGVATAAIQAGCSGFLTKDKAARVNSWPLSGLSMRARRTFRPIISLIFSAGWR